MPQYIIKEMTTKVTTFPDGIGFVELLGTFGDDLTVVNAARVSFAKESVELSPGDAKLIKYLAKHEHNSPFFHPQLRFRLKMPIFVAREWFRHTIGFARNEVSRRYVDSDVECYVPSSDMIRERDTNKKQGSKATAVDNSDNAKEHILDLTDLAVSTYNKLLSENVAPEVARMVLPQSMYTEFIETGSLAAYARLCHLRLGADAQKEIRVYAGLVDACLMEAFPVSWKALQQTF